MTICCKNYLRLPFRKHCHGGKLKFIISALSLLLWLLQISKEVKYNNAVSLVIFGKPSTEIIIESPLRSLGIVSKLLPCQHTGRILEKLSQKPYSPRNKSNYYANTPVQYTVILLM